MSERPTYANQTYPPKARGGAARLRAEIERLRDRLNLIATSPHADGWAKDRAKAALLDTPEG